MAYYYYYYYSERWSGYDQEILSFELWSGKHLAVLAELSHRQKTSMELKLLLQVYFNELSLDDDNSYIKVSNRWIELECQSMEESERISWELA